MGDIGPGTILGQYEVLEPLGVGGMARVYKAYHASLDRYVAIKVLPSQYAAEPQFLERFQQEARTVARLRHPNILEVYDFGEYQGVPYIVMEYMDGGTLASWLTGPRALGAAIAVVGQVASGLDYAHNRGILHRDIKPSNIFINSDGIAILGDFGLAKIMEAARNLTVAGTVLGTPEFMSPEQALGRPVDRRSDVYSLGVVLYTMLVGELPYSGGTALATMYAHVQEPLPPPRQRNPDIPQDVEAVVTRALAKAPEDRYATAGELAQSLAIAGGVSLGDGTSGSYSYGTQVTPPPSIGAPTAAIWETMAGPSSGGRTPMSSPAPPTVATPAPFARPTPAAVPATPAAVRPSPATPAPPAGGRPAWLIPAIVAGVILVGVVVAALVLISGSRGGSAPAPPAATPVSSGAAPVAPPVGGGPPANASPGSGAAPAAAEPESAAAGPAAEPPSGAPPAPAEEPPSAAAPPAAVEAASEAAAEEPAAPEPTVEEPAPTAVPVAPRPQAPAPAPARPTPVPQQLRPAPPVAQPPAAEPPPEAPAAQPQPAAPAAQPAAPMGAEPNSAAPPPVPRQPAVQSPPQVVPPGVPVAPMGAPEGGENAPAPAPVSQADSRRAAEVQVEPVPTVRAAPAAASGLGAAPASGAGAPAPMGAPVLPMGAAAPTSAP